MRTDLLYFNGIDGDTGSYALPPMTAAELVQVILGEATPENILELRKRHERQMGEYLGPEVDHIRLDEAGWGVIFPQYPVVEKERQKKVEAIREALQPLLQLRQQQAGERFAAWCQGTGKGFYVGKENKNAYLDRHGSGPGAADPDKVPYYLLIVGSPSDIPYDFQSQLDVDYAVGRIHFATPDEYAAYAANVVAAETGPKNRARKAAFFNVANPNDRATQLSATQLTQPLADKMRTGYPDWTVQSYTPDQAYKATLASLLGGTETPAFLFASGHGMKFAKGDPRQLSHQGALLCQDWPGPEAWTKSSIPQDFYFAGDDLTPAADLRGLIAFFFACYGGGTPHYDRFVRQAYPDDVPATRPQIAPYPFLAQLPVKMLGRSRGALAVAGHVDRAWSCSFEWGRAGTQTTVFEGALERLLKGYPIGWAMEYFNRRHASLAVMLNDELNKIDFGKRYNPFKLAELWTANNDARGYTIIGDPAVRLPVDKDR
ncbi:MAG: hypothetical protein ACP5J4_19730 [Anaerolineae bacterium]